MSNSQCDKCGGINSSNGNTKCQCYYDRWAGVDVTTIDHSFMLPTALMTNKELKIIPEYSGLNKEHFKVSHGIILKESDFKV